MFVYLKYKTIYDLKKINNKQLPDRLLRLYIERPTSSDCWYNKDIGKIQLWHRGVYKPFVRILPKSLIEEMNNRFRYSPIRTHPYFEGLSYNGQEVIVL